VTAAGPPFHTSGEKCGQGAGDWRKESRQYAVGRRQFIIQNCPSPRFSLTGGLGILQGRENLKDIVHSGHFHQRFDPVLHCRQYEEASGIGKGNVRVDNGPHSCGIHVGNLAEIKNDGFRGLLSSDGIPKAIESGNSYWTIKLENSFTLVCSLCRYDLKVFVPHNFEIYRVAETLSITHWLLWNVTAVLHVIGHSHCQGWKGLHTCECSAPVS